MSKAWNTVSEAPAIPLPPGTANEPPALSARRSEAARRAADLPPPAPHDEEWRRTDPARFPLDAWPPVHLEPRPPRPADADPLDEFFDVVIEMDGSGWSVRDRGGVTQSGRIAVLSLAEAAERHPDAVETLWTLEPAVRPRDRHEWAAMAAAAGVFIRVEPGAEFARGVLVRVRQPAGRWFCPLTMLDVSERSTLHVVSAILSEPGDGLAAETVRYRVGAGGRLRLARLQLCAGGPSQMEFVHGRLSEDAQLDAVSVHLGGAAVRSRVGAEAAGRGAGVRIGGLLLAAGTEQADQQTVQIHSAPDTTSDLLFKAAVRDRARSVYRGLIAAHRGAVRIAAYQKNQNLILNEGARVDSLPGLRIDADDLTCTHGATIGSLDPDELFYLRSRGLPESVARRLILEGFFEEIVSRLAMPALRDVVRRHLAERMDAPA